MKSMLYSALLLAIAYQQRQDAEFNAVVASPAYLAQHPIVLFDEGHNNVHRLGDRFKPFGDLLRNDGYDVQPLKGALTRDALQHATVLAIVNARGAGRGFRDYSGGAFDADEIKAVSGWVRAGGSLLLIADHAPMGSAAEALANALGARMSKGYVEDIQHTIAGADGDRGGTIVFSRDNALLRKHWITEGRSANERVAVVWTFTGQAVKGPPGSATILELASSAAERSARLLPPEPGDPPGRSRIEIGEPVPLKGWSQMVAFPLGKGRVVAVGEAGMFSAQAERRQDGTVFRFGMNRIETDNRQLLLNTMHWLSRLEAPRGAAAAVPPGKPGRRQDERSGEPQ